MNLLLLLIHIFVLIVTAQSRTQIRGAKVTITVSDKGRKRWTARAPCPTYTFGKATRGDNSGERFLGLFGERECQKKCTEFSLQGGTNAVIIRTNTRTRNKLCFCATNANKVVKDTRWGSYVITTSCFIETTPKDRCPSFIQGNARGYQSSERLFEGIPNREECLELCVEQRNIDSTINGVTFGALAGKNRCFCESNAFITGYSKTFVTCYLKVPKIHPRDGCPNMVPGDTLSVKEKRVFDSPTKEFCIATCLIEKKLDPTINAVKFGREGGKHPGKCFCKSSALKDNVQTNYSYQICFLK